MEGLPYHIVVSVDPNPVNWSAHFEDISHESAVLAYDITTTPRVVSSQQGPKTAFCSLPDSQWLDRFLSSPLGLIKTGGSVANIAFDLAVQLGADPVILIGQDLSYSEGLVNAAGTYRDQFAHRIPPGWFDKPLQELEELARTDPNAAYRLRKGRLAIPGNGGQPVWTDRTLFGFLCWFEEAIQNLGNHPRVVNATEGGARIRGSLVRTFHATLDEFCREHLANELKGILHQLSNPASLDGGALSDHLERGVAGARGLNDNCQSALGILGARGNTTLEKLDREIVAGLERMKGLLHFSLVPTLVRLQELPAPGSADWGRLRGQFYEHLMETLNDDLENMEAAIGSLGRLRQDAPGAKGRWSIVGN